MALLEDGSVFAEAGWNVPVKNRNDYRAAEEMANHAYGFVRSCARVRPGAPLAVCYEDTRFGRAGFATTGLLRGILFHRLVASTPLSLGALFAVSPSRWRSYHGLGRTASAAAKLAAYVSVAKDLGFESKLATARARTDATAAFLIGRLALPAWDARLALTLGATPTEPEMAKRIALDDKLWIVG